MSARRPLSTVGLIVLASAWGVAVSFGLGALYRYSVSPGEEASAPDRWPTDSRIARVAGLPTLVLVAHPHCSCTRATLSELSVLMTRLQGRVSATVLFIKPRDVPADWGDNDLRRSAEIISGVTVLDDEGGAEATRFGAQTSGQTLLYDAAGRLRFSGGITPVRSHAGRSVGRDRIIAVVSGGTPDRDRSDVFGCALFDRLDPSTGGSL